ncbi:PP2C family protein-serine/threonine phosphatase [Roseateles violae]|uniref:Protein phosphatase 2C domain-containing protein n=1 Tax=Roseateles violae TaxID=3058042 RepID=A0ABT8DUL9_9BURK|nr:protein phosphatase 2C domain-containing protein [Pelomonas sp. PFR6]MDN3920009.1 protein phosphatase 2C domain-containing protein [Pelomonas sp. PFR6]
MLNISATGRSELGSREHNEDRICLSREGPTWALVLADGAGGHRGGATAALYAVDEIEQALLAQGREFGAAALTHAVLAAHARLHHEQERDVALCEMHTTVVVLWIDASRDLALWSHVGDSRLYRVRQGLLRRLTNDDSVVQGLLDAGLLTPQQADAHPHRNHLLAALGKSGDVVPHTLAQPTQLQDEDVYLLCSDGWWGSLDDAGIVETLGEAASPEEWLDAMQQRIEHVGAAQQDNFSAIAVWVGDRGDVTRPQRD